MKRRGLNIQINLTNRAIYTLIAFTIFILAGVVVFAFGTSNPSTFGHTASELDLSGGIDGDVVFNGNLDVGGSVKIGSAATCDASSERALRYNSATKKIEFCNSTDWSEMGTGTVIATVIATGSGYTGNLVIGSNTGTDCTNAGGIPTDIGGGDYVCKFISSSCATGWTQYQEWSTTSTFTCSGKTIRVNGVICPVISCTTYSHVFSNKTQETCGFKDAVEQNIGDGSVCVLSSTYRTCTAQIQEVGCY